MAKKRPSRNRPAHAKRDHRPASVNSVSVKQVSEGTWRLVHPRCARERAEDIEEVDAMIAEDEMDIAIDELRWLLSGCSDFIAAHRRLGELLLAMDNDVPLARGHFGRAYQLGLAAVRRAGASIALPYADPENQAFFEAGKGLAYCLRELKRPRLAREVLEQLVALDPSEPLGLRAMLAEL